MPWITPKVIGSWLVFDTRIVLNDPVDRRTAPTKPPNLNENLFVILFSIIPGREKIFVIESYLYLILLVPK